MHRIIFTLFIIVILYGVYNNYKKAKLHENISKKSCSICQKNTQKIYDLKKELSEIESTAYVKKYIINVINHGSHDLGFKGKIMEGGYASSDDAEKIACYVLTLSGKSCKNGYEKDAPMFFTSICGGCHGNDGKGLGGTYPDLTRKKLLGIEQKENFLRTKIKFLEHENLKHIKEKNGY